MYKNSFLSSCKKTIYPEFTKFDTICRTVTYKIHTGLEFQNGMAGFVPKILKSRRKESRGRETLVLKYFPFSENFWFLWNETHRFQKIYCISNKLDHFIVSVIIFYCRSEVIVFRFYQELNADWFENWVAECHVFCQFSAKNYCIYAKWSWI